MQFDEAPGQAANQEKKNKTHKQKTNLQHKQVEVLPEEELKLNRQLVLHIYNLLWVAIINNRSLVGSQNVSKTTERVLQLVTPKCKCICKC